MAKGKKLYSFVEVDEHTPVQKLTLGDQIRLLLKRLTYDPANELKGEDAVTLEYLKLKADLTDFLSKSAKPLKQGIHKKVVVEVSNRFDPVLMEVIRSPVIAKYFKVRIARPKIDFDIPYNILLEMSVKDK